MAWVIADSVISLNIMRVVVSTGRPNRSQICHAMASPSRSPSGANIT